MAMARTEARTAMVSFMVMVMVSGDQRLEDSCPRPGLCFIPPCFSEFPERQIFLVSGKLSGQAPPCTALPSGFCLRSSVGRKQVRGRCRVLNLTSLAQLKTGFAMMLISSTNKPRDGYGIGLLVSHRKNKF